MIVTKRKSPGGPEPPAFRLTAERANRLRHGDLHNRIYINLYMNYNLPKVSAIPELHEKRKKEGVWK